MKARHSKLRLLHVNQGQYIGQLQVVLKICRLSKRYGLDTMRDGRTDSDDRGESRAGYNTSILESNSEEESSTAKLTRRGSVLVSFQSIYKMLSTIFQTDLMALFRRSSSFGHRRPSRHLHQLHDEE